MIHIMVSLDLVNAESRRDGFYKLLAAKGWVKLGAVDTIWTFSKTGYTQHDASQVEGEIAKLLTEAATEFVPTSISYVAQIGNNVAVERIVEKRDDHYGVFEV